MAELCLTFHERLGNLYLSKRGAPRESACVDLLQRIGKQHARKRRAGGAFSGCTALESVNLPKSLRTLGYGAFSECTSLAEASRQQVVGRLGAARLEADLGEARAREGATPFAGSGLSKVSFEPGCTKVPDYLLAVL